MISVSQLMIQHILSFNQLYSIISVSVGVAAINIAIETGDVDNLLKCLQNPDVFLHSVTPECAVMYMERLTEAKDTKTAQGIHTSKTKRLLVCHLKSLEGSSSMRVICICRITME